MIKIDWLKYIRNRIWFGWWYIYPDYLAKTRTWTLGKWSYYERYKWVPVTLTIHIFNKPLAHNWQLQYDLI